MTQYMSVIVSIDRPFPVSIHLKPDLCACIEYGIGMPCSISSIHIYAHTTMGGYHTDELALTAACFSASTARFFSAAFSSSFTRAASNSIGSPACIMCSVCLPHITRLCPSYQSVSPRPHSLYIHASMPVDVVVSDCAYL